MSRLLTCDEVAKRYNVEVITIWEWIRKKKMPAIKIGKSYRISEDDIAEFEKTRKTIKE